MWGSYERGKGGGEMCAKNVYGLGTTINAIN